jgi:thiamine-phosphate pyrophosphorylase
VGPPGDGATSGVGKQLLVSRSTPRLFRERLRLVVITDREKAGSRGVEAVVDAALRGGARCIQLREKVLGAGEILPLAQRLRRQTQAHGALFIVNDRVDLALACNADGVHLGPDDLPIPEVRRMTPPDFLIGFSTDDPATAVAALAEGADYLGCGTVWPTASKGDAGHSIGPTGLAAVCRAVPAPVVAIGGITVERLPLLTNTGAAGVAVIHAVMAADDPASVVRAFLVDPSP